jgi:uncharacterized protein YbjT (DUF2867 family)
MEQRGPLYVVTGATGNTGSAVADALLARGKRVRVVGRNAARLQRFVEQGAQPFVAEPADPCAMRRAFAGAAVAYVMLPPGDIPGSDDFPAFQNNLIDSIVLALGASSVSHAVALSSWGADKECCTGPVLGLRRMERRLSHLPALHVLHLRAGWFMENTIPMIQRLAAQEEAHGAIRGDLPIPMVSAADVGAAAASAMLHLNFEGKAVREVQGQRDLSLNEAVKIIRHTLARPGAAYVQDDPETAKRAMLAAGISEHVASLMLEVSDAMNRQHIHMLEPRGAANSTPTSYEDFVSQAVSSAACTVLSDSSTCRL